MAFFCQIFFIGKLLAQDVNFYAQVNRKKVPVDSSVQLTLTVEGTQDVHPIDLPSMDGFQSQYLGPSTRISIVNGKVSSSIAFIYNLEPLKIGNFQIPSISVDIEGKTYTSEPIDIEVVASSSASSGGPLGPSQQALQQATLKDKVFLVFKAAKNEAYLNEKVPIKIMLFVANVSVRDIQFPNLEKVGFLMDDFGQPQQYQQVIGGVPYEILEFNTFIYPTREGELKIGTAKIDCNIIVKSSRSSPLSQFDNLFDDDFFKDFFDNYERLPYTAESADVTMSVLPLPQEGKPSSFTGAVGKFDFNVAVSPLEVKVGDPVTLRMKVEGEGNKNSIAFPRINTTDKFKVYEPQVREEGSSKVLEQVIIPNSASVTEIPAIEFSYFDADLKKYQTIVKGPFPVAVKEAEKGQDFKIVQFEKPFQETTDVLGQDIIFIKEKMMGLKNTGYHFYRTLIYRLFIVVLILLWGGSFIWHQNNLRLQTDEVYAKKLMAPKQAQKGLKQALRFLSSSKQKEFYDILFKTLQQYLSYKLHLPIGNTVIDNVETALRQRGIGNSVLEDIKNIFMECEAVRYASVEISEENRRKSLKTTENIIDTLERRLK